MMIIFYAEIINTSFVWSLEYDKKNFLNFSALKFILNKVAIIMLILWFQMNVSWYKKVFIWREMF